AAEEWNVERGSIRAANGKVTHPTTNQSLSYAQLSKGQKLMKAIGEAPLTRSTEWKVAGKPLRKLNGREIVTGKHQYTPDIKLPGMLHGKVLRPSAFGATLVSLDAREVEKIPGVTVVRDGDFVGVAAPSQQAASRAAEAIRLEWKATPQVS